MLALDVFFSSLAHNGQLLPHAPIWLAKYDLLNTDWGYVDPNDSLEMTVIKFLEYLKDEFIKICLVLRDKKDKSDDIARSICRILPETYYEPLTYLLCNNLSLRNSDFINTLHVAPMIAIKYIRILENEQILIGSKHGHEKVYINQERILLIGE